ncbi:hypothetical protein Tco_1361496 [Tanacetum coccineum]
MVISSPCLIDNKELTSPEQTAPDRMDGKMDELYNDEMLQMEQPTLSKARRGAYIGFHQIIDFINRSHICYALTKKPEVCVSFIKQFWRSAETLTDDNGDVKIHATIDGHSLSITEGSLRRHLKFDDQDGHYSRPTMKILGQLAG